MLRCLLVATLLWRKNNTAGSVIDNSIDDSLTRHPSLESPSLDGARRPPAKTSVVGFVLSLHFTVVIDYEAAACKNDKITLFFDFFHSGIYSWACVHWITPDDYAFFCPMINRQSVTATDRPQVNHTQNCSLLPCVKLSPCLLQLMVQAFINPNVLCRPICP